jgi:WD40 repeat protein
LDDPAKEHISILGEFGTGKTMFALHYAWVALQRYRDAQKRGVELPRLPLVIPLRDYAKAVSVESLFSEFFFRQYEIPLAGYSVFEQLNRMGKLLLIFDGFDEMAARVDRQEMINNFWELAKVVVPGAKVILTCRTEHFPSDQEGRALLNADLQASTANLTGETPQFEVLELEKFNDDQIHQVLSFQASPATVELVMSNPQLLDLARRPVMSEFILEALPDIEAGKPVDMSRIYLYAVRRKMERDIKAERTFTSLADKLYFLCELSWEMVSNNQMSLNYRLFPDRIRCLFGSFVQEEKDLDHWHYDMMTQTMLIRNADGDYTPAHRSLLEFFVAYKFAAELGAQALDFTELAKVQSCLDENATPVDYTWSGYFSRQLDETGQCVVIEPLKEFDSEALEKLKETFGRSPLTKALIDLLVPMLDNNESLIKVIKATRERSEVEAGYVGGNAATLAVKVDRTVLEGKDLRRTVIKGANFSNACLQNTNFGEANLIDCVFTKFLGVVLSVAFSPDDKFLVTGDGDGLVCLWDASSGREILTYKGHINAVYSVTFSPNGQIIASCGHDRKIKLWDIYSGRCLTTLQGHTDAVRCVSFSPNGNMLASCSSDHTIKLWDIHTYKCLSTLQGHMDAVRCVSFSPNGNMLASCSSDHTIKLWDIHTYKCLSNLQGYTSVRNVTFNPDGNMLASANDDHILRVWDIRSGECLKSLQGHTGWLMSVAFSPQGEMIASSSIDETVRLWSVSKGECLKTLQGHTNWVGSIVFSSNGKILASGSDDATVRLWDIGSGECIKVLQGNTSSIYCVVFNNNSHTLACGSGDGTVTLWNIHTGKYIKKLLGHSNRVESVAFSPNSQILASGSGDQTIRLWDVNTGNCIKILQGHSGWVHSVMFLPDGQTLASTSGDQTIRLWDINTGNCIKILQGHTNWVFSASISSDGQLLASGSYDRTARLWNICTGECLNIFQEHTDQVSSVVLNPDGKTLAISSSNGIRIWSITTGECLKTLRQEKSWFYSTAFSPDGQVLVSCTNQTVRLWDIHTGKCLKVLKEHTNCVRSVAFSPDGKIIASGSWDCTIKLWDSKTGNCLKTLNNQPYTGMNITGVTNLTKAEKSTLIALGAVESTIK